MRTKTLVAYGTTRGGTEGLAVMLAQELNQLHVDAEPRPAASVTSLRGYDAVIVAGALYAGRWHRDARRFVRRHRGELRSVPVWLVSSGPLDSSADDGTLPTTREVSRLAEQVGARGTQTFGGRLAPDATGFLARSMAKTRAGDFRNRQQVERFARDVASTLGRGAAVGS